MRISVQWAGLKRNHRSHHRQTRRCEDTRPERWRAQSPGRPLRKRRAVHGAGRNEGRVSGVSGTGFARASDSSTGSRTASPSDSEHRTEDDRVLVSVPLRVVAVTLTKAKSQRALRQDGRWKTDDGRVGPTDPTNNTGQALKTSRSRQGHPMSRCARSPESLRHDLTNPVSVAFRSTDIPVECSCALISGDRRRLTRPCLSTQ